MAQFTIKIPGAPVQAAELGDGRHVAGRSLNTDLALADGSVSSAHCEIHLTAKGCVIKDLGSTNGTFIDGARVTEGALAPGQTLRLGQVEISWHPSAAAAPDGNAPESFSAPRLSETPPLLPTPTRVTLPALARRPKNFYRTIPGAFAYPFKGNGWGLLLGGTMVFGFMSYVYGFSVAGHRVIGFAGVMAIPLSLLATGYSFLFLQSIISQTAMGEAELTSWPDFENLWDSGFYPSLQLLAIVIVSMLPPFLYREFTDSPNEWIAAALALAGLFYLPMSLLAVSVYDSIFALNPMLTFPAIVKAPLAYFVCCVILGVLWMGAAVVQHGVRTLMPNEFIPIILTEFLYLYSLCVEMRILGLLYYTRQKEFGWKLA
ncbi:MAG TPA: FHA domain-containing protein [Verrucomicrobiae bacterium]|jgi:hypothetical protein|nr:FHA domain-containing protein [Verrucomicrobiae bacterium]